MADGQRPAPIFSTRSSHSGADFEARAVSVGPVVKRLRSRAPRGLEHVCYFFRAGGMTVTKERFLLIRCVPLGGQSLPAAAQVLQASVRESVQENFGDFGVGCILVLFQGARAHRATCTYTAPTRRLARAVRHYSAETGLFLVRVAREHAAMLRAAVSLVCFVQQQACLLYTSPSPRDRQKSRMPSSA